MEFRLLGRTRPAPHPRWVRTFTRAEGEMLREVARIFQDKQPRPDEQIEGFTVKLARDEAEFDGHITLRASVDGKVSSVKAQLRASDYDLAIQAHRANSRLLSPVRWSAPANGGG